MSDVIRAIGRRNPALIARPTARPRQGDPFAALERFHVAIAAITLVGSTAFLLALMVIRAEERRENRRHPPADGHLAAVDPVEVLLEGLLIAGPARRSASSSPRGGRPVNRFFQWRYDTPLMFVRVTPSIAWQAVAFSVPLGVVAGLPGVVDPAAPRSRGLVRR